MPDTQTQVYLELPPELQQLLDDNGLSVNEILRQQNIPSEVTYGVSPDELATGARSKDPVMIIFASAAAVLAVGLAVSRVLHTLQRAPQLVEYYELEALRNAEGDVLLDKKGKPHLKRVKKYELLEPRKEANFTSLEIGFNPVDGVIIKFSSAENQMRIQDKPKSA